MSLPALTQVASAPTSQDATPPSRRVSTAAAAVAAAVACSEAYLAARDRRSSADDTLGMRRFDMRNLKPLDRSSATGSVETVSPMPSPPASAAASSSASTPSPRLSEIARAGGEPEIVTSDSLPFGLEYDEATGVYTQRPSPKEDPTAHETRAAGPVAASDSRRVDDVASRTLFPAGFGRRTSAPTLGDRSRFSSLAPLAQAPRPKLEG